MKVIGLTGSIGSGKSTVASIFHSLGVACLNADTIAKRLVEPGQPALSAIKKKFGAAICLANGSLNRAALRQQIFADSEKKDWLEHLLHPLIRKAIQAQISTLSGIYCVVEIPLLNDRTAYPYIDEVLLICSDRQLQLTRVATRDNVTKASVSNILTHQLSEQKRRELADTIINNAGTLADLEQKIKALHKLYVQRWSLTH